jgi:hypothetical protein
MTLEQKVRNAHQNGATRVQCRVICSRKMAALRLELSNTAHESHPLCMHGNQLLALYLGI